MVPWRLAAGREPESGAWRRRWAIVAAPLLATALLLLLLRVDAAPDAAVAVGLGSPSHASPLLRAAGVLAAALFAADLLLLAGWRRLESAGWRITAGLGACGLAALAWSEELLRMGEGPESPRGLLLAAAACRVLVAAGAGESLAPGRPWAGLAAGLALPLELLFLPRPLLHLLLRQGDGLTLGAAALLFLLARWLPARLRRPSLLAATLLAALFLARAAALSAGMATLPIDTVGPPPV